MYVCYKEQNKHINSYFVHVESFTFVWLLRYNQKKDALQRGALSEIHFAGNSIAYVVVYK